MSRPTCGRKARFARIAAIATTSAIGRLTGKTSRPGLRKCYACRKTFTVRIGSIFEDSHFPLHLWLQAIQLIVASKKGISHPPNSADLQLQHENRLVPDPPHPRDHEAADGVGPLGGEGKTIEADVTYVGRKPGTKVSHGGGAT